MDNEKRGGRQKHTDKEEEDDRKKGAVRGLEGEGGVCVREHRSEHTDSMTNVGQQ